MLRRLFDHALVELFAHRHHDVRVEAVVREDVALVLEQLRAQWAIGQPDDGVHVDAQQRRLEQVLVALELAKGRVQLGVVLGALAARELALEHLQREHLPLPLLGDVWRELARVGARADEHVLRVASARLGELLEAAPAARLVRLLVADGVRVDVARRRHHHHEIRGEGSVLGQVGDRQLLEQRVALRDGAVVDPDVGLLELEVEALGEGAQRVDDALEVDTLGVGLGPREPLVGDEDDGELLCERLGLRVRVEHLDLALVAQLLMRD
eukprot:6176872-Pleurochrysis_carterae.AAC.1